MNIRVITDDIRATADDTVFICNSGSNDITITLPPVDQAVGKVYWFKKSTANNTVTIDAHASETIDGNAFTKDLDNDESIMGVVSDGTRWNSMGPSHVAIETDRPSTTGSLTVDGTLTVNNAGIVDLIGSNNVILARYAVAAGVIQDRWFADDDNLRYIWQMTTGDDDGDDDGNEMRMFIYEDDGTNKGSVFRIDRLATNGRLGFHGVTPRPRTAVTGSRSGGAALANLLSELSNKGLIIDSTTA